MQNPGTTRRKAVRQTVLATTPKRSRHGAQRRNRRSNKRAAQRKQPRTNPDAVNRTAGHKARETKPSSHRDKVPEAAASKYKMLYVKKLSTARG